MRITERFVPQGTLTRRGISLVVDKPCPEWTEAQEQRIQQHAQEVERYMPEYAAQRWREQQDAKEKAILALISTYNQQFLARPSASLLLELVCLDSFVSLADLVGFVGRSRERKYQDARAIAAVLLRLVTKATWVDAAAAMGVRNHTTPMSAFNRASKDPELWRRAERLALLLGYTIHQPKSVREIATCH